MCAWLLLALLLGGCSPGEPECDCSCCDDDDSAAVSNWGLKFNGSGSAIVAEEIPLPMEVALSFEIRPGALGAMVDTGSWWICVRDDYLQVTCSTMEELVYTNADIDLGWHSVVISEGVIFVDDQVGVEIQDQYGNPCLEDGGELVVGYQARGVTLDDLQIGSYFWPFDEGEGDVTYDDSGVPLNLFGIEWVPIG